MWKISDTSTVRHHYKIRSSRPEHKFYYVGQLKSSNRWICQCEHFLYRLLPETSEKPCRHIQRVMDLLKKRRKQKTNKRKAA